MTQAQPSYMTKFRIFWEAMDAVMVRRGLKPLDYETARRWFEAELPPEDAADVIAAAHRATPHRGASPLNAALRNASPHISTRHCAPQRNVTFDD